MAFFGRGRGRGRGRGGYCRFVEEKEPDKLFPDIELPDIKNVTVDEEFYKLQQKVRGFMKESCYSIEDKVSDEGVKSMDIVRYSDMIKIKKDNYEKEHFTDFMKLEKGFFPNELVEGIKRTVKKKVKWNTNSGKDKLDLLEKLEATIKGKEEEEEEDVEEEEEDEMSDDDYEQMEKYDDDEDDYNMSDDGDDGPVY